MHIFFAATVMVAQSFFGGLPIDGIHCDAVEGVVEHIHAHVSLYDRGHAIVIPQGVGIPETGQCLYWLHTHAPDGIVHIEAPVKRPFTLGQFFDIWGMSLSWQQAAAMTAKPGSRLAVWVDGKRWYGSNPRAIVLHDREEIVIQNGPPFATPQRGSFP